MVGHFCGKEGRKCGIALTLRSQQRHIRAMARIEVR